MQFLCIVIVYLHLLHIHAWLYPTGGHALSCGAGALPWTVLWLNWAQFEAGGRSMSPSDAVLKDHPLYYLKDKSYYLKDILVSVIGIQIGNRLSGDLALDDLIL